MARPGQELAALDFESLIGGPLMAVVRAQAQSALTSVDYIKSIGFKEKDGELEPVTVSFTYEKDDDDGNPQKFALSVPLLTMVPIPFLRVEETNIDFNAKIVSTQFVNTSSNIGFNASLEAKAGWGWGSAKLKTSFSYRRSTNSGNKTERTYTMNVRVRAVQDELPAGTERLLGILENSIQERGSEAVEPAVILLDAVEQPELVAGEPEKKCTCGHS